LLLQPREEQILKAKKTHLLDDEPATADELGTHKQIARAICAEIVSAREGRSLALIGDWGSGKSTVIELLKDEIKNKPSVRLFIYDAWAHQGDALRRAFLDDLIASLSKLVDEKILKDATEEIWNRSELVTTKRQPVLRRHAKILLISLLVFSIGWKILQLPPTTPFLSEIWWGRNLLAVSAMLVPLLIGVFFWVVRASKRHFLKKYLFGEEGIDQDFSILSFFFEKTQGTIERRHIKTPADSIRSFRDIFFRLLDSLQTQNRNLRFVIVIDNIDRIPADQVREFWSTMQTFFGDGGGIKSTLPRKYWLITPFSVKALSSLFLEDKGVPAGHPHTAQAYVDRTFSLAFHVPPPILTNGRKYLLDKLATALPEHAEADRVAARDAFYFARSTADSTPRGMKLFVNSLVALYRLRGEDIPLGMMAVYILHRETIDQCVSDIDQSPEAADGTSPRERRLAGDADWQVLRAAMAFGVSVEDATQIILERPVRVALQAASKQELKTLESRVGFIDVLTRVITSEVEGTGTDKGPVLARMAASIGCLDRAVSPELTVVWGAIQNRAKSVTDWSGLDEVSADGIEATLAHTPPSERASLCQALAASLATAAISEPEAGSTTADQGARFWLLSALAVARSVDAAPTKIGFPGGNGLKLELLQQLAESPPEGDLMSVFSLNAAPSVLGRSIGEQISVGRFPRVQMPLVSLFARGLKLDPQWAAVTEASAQRLRVLDLGAPEARALVELLLAIGIIASQAPALLSLAQLSTEGFLSNLMHQHRTTPDAVACEITAVVIANPAFDRPTPNGQSPLGDTFFNQTVEASDFDQALITRIATMIRSLDAGALLFERGTAHAKISKLSAAVLGELSRTGYRFRLTGKSVIDQQAFLAANAALNPIAEFLSCLADPDDLLQGLAAEAFGVNRIPFYLECLHVQSPNQGAPYRAFLENGVLAQDDAAWSKALSGDGTYLDLLTLALELRAGRGDFELSTNARDAIRNQIREAAGNASPTSDKFRGRVSQLVDLLATSQRVSLQDDIVDDLIGSDDPARTARHIDISCDYVRLNPADDASRVVRRIFAPIVSHPTDRTAAWVLQAIADHPDSFTSIAAEAREDFAARLRQAMRGRDSLPAGVAEKLVEIANVLQIGLAADDQATPAGGGDRDAAEVPPS
jgi:hypothetical protein